MILGGILNRAKSNDLITFKVLIDGKELSKIHQVKDILISKEVNRIPTAKIVLLDGDVAKSEFELSNEKLLIPGKKIEITAGYNSDEETVFKGIIIKHNIRIRSNSSQLIVECKDETVKMTIGRKSKYYYDSADSDIFEEIIKSYKLKSEVETSNFTHAEMIQYNVSDWDFMVSRAQANGLLCFVEEGKVIISKPDLKGEEVASVIYGTNLLEFDAEIDARDQVKKVSSYGWDYSNQEMLEVEGKDPNISLNGNLSSSDLSDTIDLENLQLKHGGSMSTEELQSWADAKFTFQQLAKVRGRVRFQGIAGVKPNTIIKLEGVGDRYNGKAYITAVSHVISDGNWTVNAQFGLNPEWFSETYDIQAQPAAGLMPAINGLQIGIVSQLEEDPEGEERILVRIPIIDSEEQGVWCRVTSLDAGENRGAFFRPEIGDEVIVGFINQDPSDAIVLGMMNSSTKPAPLVASDDNHEKGFFTRSEMKILFNDDKKSLKISTPAGKLIALDEDEGTILLEDEHSNKITMSSDGITIESAGDIEMKATGDVIIEGMNVAISANAEFKAEGTSGAEVSSSAIAVLKGSLVQIN